jgi:hypothetical protein
MLSRLLAMVLMIKFVPADKISPLHAAAPMHNIEQ